MIQRAQSVYLLLVTILMSFSIIFPYAEFYLADGRHILFASHSIISFIDGSIANIIKGSIPLLLLFIIAGIVSFVNIFFFSRRPLQMRLCVLNTLFLIAQISLIAFYYYSVKSDLPLLVKSFKLPAIFPLVGIILNLIAYRAIKHDEELVNSYKRIR